MAPDTRTVILLRDLYVRVVRVCLARPMTTLAREAFVLVFLQLGNLLRVTFFAGFGAGKYGFACLQFRQCFPTVPSVLFE